MTPEDIAKAGTEHAHQAAIFCWCNEQVQNGKYPMLKFIHAIPSGGKRDKVTASRLKAEGVKQGVWDIFLPYPVRVDPYSYVLYHGLYIEMKKPDKGRLTDEQKIFREHVEPLGYYFAVCYTWLEAKDAIVKYLPNPS